MDGDPLAAPTAAVTSTLAEGIRMPAGSANSIFATGMGTDLSSTGATGDLENGSAVLAAIGSCVAGACSDC